jgi:hypothetical protein
MASMLSGSGDGLGGGLSCPEKDRCTNYSCTGGFLRVFRELISGFHDRLRTRPSSLFMYEQYNPEDSSEHHTRRRENLKSHITYTILPYI